MGRNGVLGVIVPISEDRVMHDVFHGKSVYASLAQDKDADLARGDRILFYDSGKTRNLVGEAVVTEVAFERAGRVADDHEGELHLDGPRFARYLSSLPEGHASMLRVIRFKDPTMYANPVRCSMKISENGTYMTADVFSSITKDNV